MTRTVAAYAATAITMIALDLLWLGLIAGPVYRQGIGHLMADAPDVPVAVVFYALFAAGLVFFALARNGMGNGWRGTLLVAGLFGFFTYGTYDLTNLATLKNWPVGIALMDMAWGVVVSVASAAAGKLALDRFARP